MKICPTCRKRQLYLPLVLNPLSKDGQTYICRPCKEEGK
jgi:superfamily II helicase